MAATKDQLISDLILRVSGGKPADDLELERSQVAFWLSQAGNAVVKADLDKKIFNGDIIDSFYIEKLECKDLIREYSICSDGCDRLYVKLDRAPIDLRDDSGIIRVKTSEGTKVEKTTLGEVDMISQMEFCKPSTENLVYYREGSKVVVMGIPKEMIGTVSLTIWYIPKLDIECLTEDAEVKIADYLIPLVLESAEEIARRQIYGPQDLENDGQQDLNLSK